MQYLEVTAFQHTRIHTNERVLITTGRVSERRINQLIAKYGKNNAD